MTILSNEIQSIFCATDEEASPVAVAMSLCKGLKSVMTTVTPLTVTANVRADSRSTPDNVGGQRDEEGTGELGEELGESALLDETLPSGECVRVGRRHGGTARLCSTTKSCTIWCCWTTVGLRRGFRVEVPFLVSQMSHLKASNLLMKVHTVHSHVLHSSSSIFSPFGSLSRRGRFLADEDIWGARFSIF